MDNDKRKNGDRTGWGAKKAKVDEKSNSQNAGLNQCESGRAGAGGTLGNKADGNLGGLGVVIKSEFDVTEASAKEGGGQGTLLPRGEGALPVHLGNEQSVPGGTHIPPVVVVKKEVMEVETTLSENNTYDQRNNSNGPQNVNHVILNYEISNNAEAVNSLLEDTPKKICCVECSNQFQHLENVIREKDMELSKRTALLEEFMARQLTKEATDADFLKRNLTTELSGQIQETGSSSMAAMDNEQHGGNWEEDGCFQQKTSGNANVVVDQTFAQLIPYLSQKAVPGGRFLSFEPISVSISQPEFLNLKDNTNKLLKVHGKQIWHLGISSYYGRLESTGEFYQRLVSCLSMTPNIRSLHVYGHDMEEYQSLDISPSHPFPVLPKLESLTLEWIGEDISVIVPLLKSYLNVQLCDFSCPGWVFANWFSSKDIEPFPTDINLNGLIELKITGNYGPEDNEPHNHRDGHLRISDLLCGTSLRKLEIGTSDHEGANEVLLATKLNGLNIHVLDLTPCVLWSISKEKLSMDIWTSWSLPVLHTLRLRHKIGDSYNYLGRMPSLQNLEFFINLTSYSDPIPDDWLFYQQSALSKLMAHDDNDECSKLDDKITNVVLAWICGAPGKNTTPIWNLIPKLDCISVTFKSFLPKKISYHRINSRLAA